MTAAIFSYLDLLRTQGIDKRYFDELAHVLALDFRYPSINRDMDYVEWLADTMIRVPVEHALDVVNIADQYDPQAIQRPAGDDDPAERPHLVYQPPGAA
ncbi:protease III [Klebsiella pneumoniae]|nr:protease III [Klebsiella pneumoniae]